MTPWVKYFWAKEAPLRKRASFLCAKFKGPRRHPVDQQAAGRKPIDDLRVMAEHCRSAKISVAGGIKPETVPEYAALKPEVLIVGSGIAHAKDPKEAARQIKESMNRSMEGRE